MPVKQFVFVICVNRGETMALVGESGCGKSTSARAILRLLEPTSGRVKLDGVDVTGLGKQDLRRARRDMQIVFQDPYASLNPRMTIRQILSEKYQLLGQEVTRKTISDLLDTVGLAEEYADRYPHEFSGGARRARRALRPAARHPHRLRPDRRAARPRHAPAAVHPDGPREGRARGVACRQPFRRHRAGGRPDGRPYRDRVAGAYEFAAKEWHWSSRHVRTELTPELLHLYFEAAEQRIADATQSEFDAMVEAVRVGTILAHDAKAYRKWTGRRKAEPGVGLAGADLERTILGLASAHPDLVAMGA